MGKKKVHHANPFSWYCFAMCISIILSALPGCGSGLGLVPGHGVIKHEGTPLNGGKVLFTPLEQGESAIGVIQPDGTFVLATRRDGEGGMPGQYRVTVISDLQVKGRELHVNCMSPRKRVFTLAEGSNNNFEINISRADGWQVVVDN